MLRPLMAKQKTAKEKSSPYPGTVAVTGSGYKGSALLRWLENDRSIPKAIFLDHKKPSLHLKKTKFYRIDLTETLVDVQLKEIFEKEKVDTLVHTAIPITPPHNVARAHELLSVGSMYICNAAAAAHVRKLILASTAEVYGAFPDNPNYLTEKQSARGGENYQFIADKIDAENRFLVYARKNPGTVVTILRPATILGPHIQSFKTHYLSRLIIPTVLGFDPLVQFIHEKDLLRAFQCVVKKDFPGIFNLASRGVIPLSRAIQLLGKINLPMTLSAMKPLAQLLWYLDISPAPASYLDYLKYMVVMDTEKAEKEMGFAPDYSCKEALMDFVGAERLRDVKLKERYEV